MSRRVEWSLWKCMSLLSLFAIVALTAGCSKNEAPATGSGGGAGAPAIDGTNVGNGFYLDMTADLTDAVSLTTPIKTAASQGLLKVTDDSRIESVLSGPHYIRHWKQTETHIIAQVAIDSDSSGRCSLIAIPKVRGRTKVLCLERQALHLSHSSDNRAQFDVQGNEVVFTRLSFEDPKQEQSFAAAKQYQYFDDGMRQITELRRWDGKSEKVSTLFHAHRRNDKLSALEQVYASSTNRNVCVSTFHWGDDSGGAKRVFCFDDAKKKWHLEDEVRADANTVKVANLIATDEGNFDLDTLTYKKVNRRYPGLPAAIDYRLEDGGLVGRAGENIVCLNKDGESQLAATVDRQSTRLVRDGNYAWFFGSKELKRLSLTDCKVEPTNYFPGTDLVQIASIAWSLGERNAFLRIEGTASENGIAVPATRFIDSRGELVFGSSKDVVIEHPIELKWD